MFVYVFKIKSKIIIGNQYKVPNVWIYFLIYIKKKVTVVSKCTTCNMHGIFFILCWTLMYCNISWEPRGTCFHLLRSQKSKSCSSDHMNAWFGEYCIATGSLSIHFCETFFYPMVPWQMRCGASHIFFPKGRARTNLVVVLWKKEG